MSFSCRLCHHTQVDSIIPLGEMPVANALLNDPGQQSKRFNLEVMLCAACGLAQLKDTLPPKDLFEHYVYASSHSETMLMSAKKLVDRLVKTLSHDAFIVEIASNDGYLLKNYLQHPLSVLGIDPAKNIAQMAIDKGIPTLCEFFSFDLAEKMIQHYPKADIIHANNVLAHVPDLMDVLLGMKALLKPTGMIIIEVPYFKNLIDHLEFDTIYHEHVYYFSIKPLKYAFEKAGLSLFDIEPIPVHGGSLRLFVGHPNQHAVSSMIDSLEHSEQYLYDVTTYQKFMHALSVLKNSLHQKLQDFHEKGSRIAAYGASAKGTTLLNFFEIGSFIDFVVDKNPLKQGKWTPGTGLKIVDPDQLITVDAALLLTWNFADEIMKQQQKFIDQGGEFIIPIQSSSL